MSLPTVTANCWGCNAPGVAVFVRWDDVNPMLPIFELTCHACGTVTVVVGR